ncbi:hypothetical protein QC760_010194 [Botrytis cinerea]
MRPSHPILPHRRSYYQTMMIVVYFQTSLQTLGLVLRKSISMSTSTTYITPHIIRFFSFPRDFHLHFLSPMHQTTIYPNMQSSNPSANPDTIYIRPAENAIIAIS